MTLKKPGIDVEALTREFDAFCAGNLPSEVVSGLQEHEGKHLEYVSSQYGRPVSQFEASYDVLARIIDHVNYGAERAKWPGRRLVQFVIAVENLKPIYSAHDRLLKGYYEDSLTLMRVAYEAFVRIIFISLHPDDPCYSFAERRKGATQFQLTNFLKHDLGLDWNEYDILSAMAHSYKVAVLKHIVEIGREGQKEPLTLSFTYDRVLLAVSLNLLDFLLLVYLLTATTVLLRPTKSGALDSGLLSRTMRCIELWQKHFMSHPDEHWRIVADDVRHVFRIVTEAEDGKDWKRICREPRGA